MNKLKVMLLLGVVGILGSSFFQGKIPGEEIPYPTGYRTWAHVKSTIVTAESPLFKQVGGYNHIYANDKAMTGYKSGNFPDGSILVFDVLGTVEIKGIISEGKRSKINVMVKDSKKYSSTGNWGFEEFTGDSKTERIVQETIKTRCFSCHDARKKNDLVLSEYRE